MTIEKTQDGKITTLHVNGRLDANTSGMLQKAVLESFQTSKHLVLDMAQAVYVSSAGLRVLLIGQKTANSKGGSMEMVNVLPQVRSVLDTVGLSKIMSIR